MDDTGGGGGGGPFVAVVLRGATPLRALHHYKCCLCTHANRLICADTHVPLQT